YEAPGRPLTAALRLGKPHPCGQLLGRPSWGGGVRSYYRFHLRLLAQPASGAFLRRPTECLTFMVRPRVEPALKKGRITKAACTLQQQVSCSTVSSLLG